MRNRHTGLEMGLFLLLLLTGGCRFDLEAPFDTDENDSNIQKESDDSDGCSCPVDTEINRCTDIEDSDSEIETGSEPIPATDSDSEIETETETETDSESELPTDSDSDTVRTIEELREDFQNTVDVSNACDNTDECGIIWPGCPLACGTAVNLEHAATVSNQAELLIAEYESFGGSPCDYDCDDVIAVCNDHTCEAVAR